MFGGEGRKRHLILQINHGAQSQMIEESLTKDRAFVHVLTLVGFPEITSEMKHRLS